MQAITSLFTVKPVTRRPKVAKRGSLQVVAHGGVGGSGGPQYPGKDKPHGSDQAPWKKKLILHDDDQADPDANQRSGQRWTPPPPKQESFAAAPPAQSTSSWDSPSSGSGGSSNAYSWDSGGSSSSSSAGSAKGRPTHYDPDQYDPDANQRGYMGGGGGGGGGGSAPKPSYGGSTGGGYAAAKPQRVTRGSDGVVYDPDQYDPDANQRSSSRFHADLAQSQWHTLGDLLERKGSSNPRSMLVAVKKFVTGHGKGLGSAPFLLGLRAFLEAQRGGTECVAWVLSPAVFTQSGGEIWMRDAVDAIASGADRRVDLEGDDGNDVPLSDADKRLAWSLPLQFRDGDIDEVLSQIPSKARLEDAGCGPTGEIVRHGAHPPGAPARTAGTGKRRGCRARCCFLPFLFVAATLCCVVVLVR